MTVWVNPDPLVDGRLKLGDRSYVGRNSYLGVHESIEIGPESLVGAYSYVISGNHAYASRTVPIRDQGYTGGRIVIGRGVWLGTHVVVLPGVTIGDGAIVAAGSVVNRDVPAYQVWGGVPARFLKDRP